MVGGRLIPCGKMDVFSTIGSWGEVVVGTVGIGGIVACICWNKHSYEEEQEMNTLGRIVGYGLHHDSGVLYDTALTRCR